mgnify:CR=1 FL=1
MAFSFNSFISLLLLGVISAISCLFGRVMLVWIVNAANFACCMAYCIVAFSFLILRYKSPEMPRPYKIKAGKLVGIIAILMSGTMALMYVIPGTNCSLVWQEWIIVGGWILLGAIFGIQSKLKYKDKFASDMDKF